MHDAKEISSRCCCNCNPLCNAMHCAMQPPTYAIGALSASGAHYTESLLDSAVSPPRRGLLTSNGGISPFIKELMTQLQCERVPSGGAGNKVMSYNHILTYIHTYIHMFACIH